ncbi:hypothetical protein Ahy_B06g083508 [Arachis hypogaea]|uniref:Uncharacterized protein n=1 Tax=Arachis hypogaea TaxID=3818 RepID=A0A444YQ21_ARAHY|nr:hypothetical protein Ahy_B06g083508 [Arachis hypogaea]
MNLTAVKDADEVMERHVEDSLTILPPFRDCYRTCCGGASSHERLSLMDVGTGAGIPGVVLAIACPVSYVVKVRVIPKALLHHEVQFHPDVSTTMVVKPGPLLDFLCENKNVKHPNLIDWTKAFEKVWKAVCSSKGDISKLIILAGKTFMLKLLSFNGPCKSKYTYVQKPVKPMRIERWTVVNFSAHCAHVFCVILSRNVLK